MIRAVLVFVLGAIFGVIAKLSFEGFGVKDKEYFELFPFGEIQGIPVTANFVIDHYTDSSVKSRDYILIRSLIDLYKTNPSFEQVKHNWVQFEWDDLSAMMNDESVRNKNSAFYNTVDDVELLWAWDYGQYRIVHVNHVFSDGRKSGHVYPFYQEKDGYKVSDNVYDDSIYRYFDRYVEASLR